MRLEELIGIICQRRKQNTWKSSCTIVQPYIRVQSICFLCKEKTQVLHFGVNS